jgi:hypothetical protein
MLLSAPCPSARGEGRPRPSDVLAVTKLSIHPLERNAKRLAPVSPARAGLYSSVEETEMLQLEDRYIAMKMAKLVETKTAKQIRDKRWEPAYIAKRSESLHIWLPGGNAGYLLSHLPGRD